jgi:hypothetical protein
MNTIRSAALSGASVSAPLDILPDILILPDIVLNALRFPSTSPSEETS